MHPFYEQKTKMSVLLRDQFVFPAHLHRYTELLYVFSGSFVMGIDGHNYVLQPGDTAIAFPDHIHSYECTETGGQAFLMIFPPDISRDFGHILLSKVPQTPILYKNEAHADLKRVMEVLRSEFDGEINEAVLRGYIQVILARLLPGLQLQPRQTQNSGDLLFDAMYYLSNNFEQHIELETVAHSLGVSKFKLSRMFSERLGMNFRTYINMLRIDKACCLLSGTDSSITQICYECGYENQRTFNRCFVSIHGITPSQYRENCFEKEGRA